MRFHSSLIFILIATVATSYAATGPDEQWSEAVTHLSTSMTSSPSVNAATGFVRHADFTPGTIAAGAPTKTDKAEIFLLRHGRAFGIAHPGLELDLPRERVDRQETTHFIYRQVFRGVPVFGGRLGIHFDTDDELVAANGSIVPISNDVPSQPELSADRAIIISRSIMAKDHQINEAALDATMPELVVFNDGVIWGREGGAHLSWRLEVSDSNHVHEEFFLDAVTGQILERINRIEHIQRRIYENDGSNLVWQEGDALPYDGSAGLANSEINNLITVAEETYTTFSNISGGTYLSWNGSDISMRSYYDRTGMDCPNAYFDGSSTSFCVGTATDDVIAHEWAHGYTRSTHNLVYAWQPGALNEAYSDVFGETVDILYDGGTDSPGGIREPETCSSATTMEKPELTVTAPAPIAGPMNVGSARFNPAPPWSATGELELADDGTGQTNDACDPLVDFTPGKIAVITMGSCSERFVTPVSNAEAAGAIAAIVVNPVNDAVTTMPGSGQLGIPSVFLGRTDGDILRDAIDEGVVVTMRSGGNGSKRWLIGEDSTSFGGAIRDMWRPECLGDPGRVSSDRYYCGEGDNGGVHINSGVPNHAFALLVDGGSFNGFDVPAIGLTRATQIYWRAMNLYQFPLSDFRDHADALAASCADLMGSPLPDPLTGQVSADVITAAHCEAVDTAMKATEMRQWPSQCRYDTILASGAPELPTGLVLLDESFDDDPGNWVLSNDGVFAEYIPRDWTWTENLPIGGDGGAFFALDSPTLGNCREGDDDQSGVVHLDSPAVSLPDATRPVLVFDHYVATEKRVDGGNLKISVNGGPFQVVPSEAFLFNPYNDILRPAPSNDNPMGGEEAFVGTDATTYRGSWGQSQVHLGELVRGGDTIVLRFDFGTDGCAGQDGWYVDNVRLTMEPKQRSGSGRVTP